MNRLRVLVVDDEIEWVHTLVERLELREIHADFVTSGTEAIDRILEKDYDVVILDMVLQRTKGLDILRQIKKEKPRLSVILVSGRGSDKDFKECKHQGAFEYLIKPIKIDDLIYTMRRAVSESKKERKK